MYSPPRTDVQTLRTDHSGAMSTSPWVAAIVMVALLIFVLCGVALSVLDIDSVQRGKPKRSRRHHSL